MFFNSKINYKTSPIIPKYPSTCTVYEWQKSLRNLEGIDSKVVAYVEPKWQYNLVKRNFQKEIDSQYCITPKIIATTKTTIANPRPAQYQKLPLEKLNATDIREGSKIITDSYIKKQSNNFADNVIKNMKKPEDKDLKIKQLQNEIETLKKGVGSN